MMRKAVFVFISLFISNIIAIGQNNLKLLSPDNSLAVEIEIGDKIKYSVQHVGETVIFPSPISIKLNSGDLGVNSNLKKVKRHAVNTTIEAPFYKRTVIEDHYNELTLIFKENFNLVFRAYNDGIAYRFITTGKNDFIVVDEEANFNLGYNSYAYIPYVRNDSKTYEEQYSNSFENIYSYKPVNTWEENKLAFSPIVIERNEGKKIAIAEADLINYPGMFLYNPEQSNMLKGKFASYPRKEAQGKYNPFQMEVVERESHIAQCKAKTSFPWRIILVSQDDKELADSDMVYKLSSPSKISDVTWIKPGKVAWEWWNASNLYGVDFKTGINNETYKYYIDFASKYGIEYVILDEGWSVRGVNDLFQVVSEIDLKELVSYAGQRDVGIILWAGYASFHKDVEKICRHYSEMGIKGFKIDFMDRDDQFIVNFHTSTAEIAAKYKLVIDFHGTYKPTGLQRTYPNVLNFEGVHGLEQLKFPTTVDQVEYDVTAPFIRQIAGPMDYTQGAMRNASKDNFRSVFSEPMSQGTRCRQLAAYTVFESPLNMLCDSPSNYEREKDCTDFIASVPTVWDNTIVIGGVIGEYIATARHKNGIWYIGAMTNWDEREIELDLSFLGDGHYEAVVFSDGINANRIARDYKKETIDIVSDRKLVVKMAKGGGCTLRITKK